MDTQNEIFHAIVSFNVTVYTEMSKSECVQPMIEICANNPKLFTNNIDELYGSVIPNIFKALRMIFDMGFVTFCHVFWRINYLEWKVVYQWIEPSIYRLSNHFFLEIFKYRTIP
jgi:hypothetical protein